MKKRYFLIVALVTASLQYAHAQTSQNSPINFTPAGDFYTGQQQSLVIVDGVIYRDGISNHFRKTDPALAYNFINTAHTGAKPDLNPDDIKEVKVLNRTAAELLYGERGANGAIIIETKKATDK